jgi:hypothetical protein
MPNRTLVPDKLQGYLLQVKHMLLELISLDDRIVSVEMLDDVAVEVNGTVIAEQIKSVTSNNNPIAERSPVFWKTLYNWCTYIEDGSLPSDAILKFVVVANRNIEPGDIQNTFANAQTNEEAQSALESAKATILLGSRTDDSVDAYEQLPESYRDYMKYLFDDVKKETVYGIIKAMDIEIHTDTYDADLLELFCNQTIPEEYADVLLTHMLGWVTRQVESFTKDNRPAFILASEYRKELNSQIRASNDGSILRAVSTQPSVAEIGNEFERFDTYIKQLRLIDIDRTTLIGSVSDYLRTKIEKTEWAQRGIVTADSFDDYHDALCRTWTNQKRLSETQYGSEPIKCGQVIYSNCSQQSSSQKLQGVETPSFFGNGSLQGLANDIDNDGAPRIGWHPQYKDLLKEVKHEQPES